MIRHRFMWTWIAELIFGKSRQKFPDKSYKHEKDSIVFFTTLLRIVPMYRLKQSKTAIPLVKLMIRDGQ